MSLSQRLLHFQSVIMWFFFIVSFMIVLVHCQVAISEISDGQIQAPLTSQSSAQPTITAVLIPTPVVTTDNIQPSQIPDLPTLSTTKCVTSSLFNCQWVFSPDPLNECPTSTVALPFSCTSIVISTTATPSTTSMPSLTPSPYVLVF
jgi:hypothetical protein